MHPSESIRCSKSAVLSGKRIVLGITGSIAAVECLELARELIRHGADVHAVMTPEALKIITHHSMEFATGNPVTTEIDGRVQHVALLGDFPDRAHMLLIAPCTANTISKIANGIDDTPVTTMATTAMGSGARIMIAPAMHSSMFLHPVIQKNVASLRDLDVDFVGPRMEGKKAKLAPTEEIVSNVIRRLGMGDLRGRRVLVIGGSSEEPIDDMRVITNKGTGETAVQLAIASFERGADVELWMGRALTRLPAHIPLRRFITVEDLMGMIPDVDHEVIIVPAALSDFAPVRAEGKISSGKDMSLQLKHCPKVLEALRGKGGFLIGFKAESGVGKDELARRATERLRKARLDMIVANDLEDVTPTETKVLIITKDGRSAEASGTKRGVAEAILDEVPRATR